MAKYHKYVFDIEQRKFIGNFEEMYQNESKEIFDSWHQEDSRQLQRRINLTILHDYNFDLILDLGCGKGVFTHLLKKENNKVIGIAISETALNIAKERYPDIDFVCLDISKADSFDNLLKNIERIDGGGRISHLKRVFFLH